MALIGDYDTPKPERKPTLLQYLKTAKITQGLKGTKFLIEVVFLPGKFDNVTLITHAFRIPLTPKHPLYAEFTKSDILTELGKNAYAVQLLDGKGKFKIVSHSKSGRWEALGEYGLKFKTPN